MGSVPAKGVPRTFTSVGCSLSTDSACQFISYLGFPQSLSVVDGLVVLVLLVVFVVVV